MAVMTTMTPLIIWYTLAAHIVNAMNMRDDPQISNKAGTAMANGLILLSSLVLDPPKRNLLKAKRMRQKSSPTNMTAHCKY